MQPGTVISLEGPLGAGKTQLSQGRGGRARMRDEASSPSFTLVHEYAGGRFPSSFRFLSPQERAKN